MAQGMRHWMSALSPNMCGKVVLKDGAACTAGNAIIPGGKYSISYQCPPTIMIMAPCIPRP